MHWLILPTRSFITRLHLISFCRLLYRQSLPIHLCERYSESQPMRSWIWLCFLPYQFQVKLTDTLGSLSVLGEHLPSDSSVLIFASTEALLGWCVLSYFLVLQISYYCYARQRIYSLLSISFKVRLRFGYTIGAWVPCKVHSYQSSANCFMCMQFDGST